MFICGEFCRFPEHSCGNTGTPLLTQLHSKTEQTDFHLCLPSFLDYLTSCYYNLVSAHCICVVLIHSKACSMGSLYTFVFATHFFHHVKSPDSIGDWGAPVYLLVNAHQLVFLWRCYKRPTVFDSVLSCTVALKDYSSEMHFCNGMHLYIWASSDDPPVMIPDRWSGRETQGWKGIERARKKNLMETKSEKMRKSMRMRKAM